MIILYPFKLMPGTKEWKTSKSGAAVLLRLSFSFDVVLVTINMFGTMLFKIYISSDSSVLYSFPCPSLQAHKMYQCLVDYQDNRLGELVAAFSHSDEHKSVHHLRSTIAAAVDHYHTWQARRNLQPFR